MSKVYLQEKLVGQPGQVVGFDADGRAVVEDNIGQGGIGINLFDNWYFRTPINQRGANSYTAEGYTIDRWILSNPGQGITLGDDGITMLSADAEWTQRLEGIAAYAGQPMTLSMLLTDGTLHTGTVAAINWALDTPQTAFDDDEMSCTITQIDTDVCEVTYTMKTAGLVLVAAKMEMRYHQTLARKNDGVYSLNEATPNKTKELIKCQLYYIQDLYDVITGEYKSNGGYVVFYGTMRTTPKLIISNNGKLGTQNGNANVTSAVVGGMRSGTIHFRTIASIYGAGSGMPAVWYGFAASLSAEL